MKKPTKKTPRKKPFAPDSRGNIHLGAFYLGWREVDLFATVPPHEGGGCFYYSPETGRLPRIKVSIHYDKWPCVVGVLLHEAMEFALEDHHARFNPSAQLSNSHASYWFIIDHEKFTECAAITGQFMADCLPKLAHAFEANSKKRGKK